MRAPISFEWTLKPGDSESVIPVDSTRRLSDTHSASLASGSAYFVPGANRAYWAGAVVSYSILCTDQNVTVLEQVLSGTDEDANDWETQGVAGTVTITAGTTTVREFKPLTPDFRLRVDAGATTPTLMQMRIMIRFSSDYGS